MDIWTKEKRSKVMSRIKSKNTKPEIRLRTALHKLGYRYSLYRSDLPGKPDIVLPKYSSIIYVHGCFWHFHKECNEGKIPKSNSEYWKNKIGKTIVRDKRHQKDCVRLGWNVIIVWECEIEGHLQATIEKVEFQLRNG